MGKERVFRAPHIGPLQTLLCAVQLRKLLQVTLLLSYINDFN